MAKPPRSDGKFTKQLRENREHVRAYMRGEYTPARVKVVFMLDHPDDEISVSGLTAEQRAAIAAGAEVAFLIRTPDTADGFTGIPAPRTAALLAQLRAALAPGDLATIPTR